jgi:putative molybdopterin biosynthesis protein
MDRHQCQAREKSARMGMALLACSSNDQILDMLQTYIKKIHPEFLILSANTGSTEGLRALNNCYTDLAWSHLFDPKSGKYNIPFLPAYVPNVKVVVVNLFHRDLGLGMAPRDPLGIKGFGDLNKKGVRLVNRQKDSDTRVLLDYHLKQLNVSASNLSENDFLHGFPVISEPPF